MKTHDERELYNKDGRTGVVDVEREREEGGKKLEEGSLLGF